MRWDGLFEDLEAQAAALDQAERAAEVEARTRGEVAVLGLADRLRGASGTPIRVRLPGALIVSGVITRVGPDWLLLDEGGGREVIVVAARVLGVRGLSRLSAAPGSEGPVVARLGLRHALRGVARDRSAVRMHLAESAGPHDQVVLDGTVDRIGADFVELAVHPAGEARRRQDVREVEVVAMSAIVAIRRQV